MHVENAQGDSCRDAKVHFGELLWAIKVVGSGSFVTFLFKFVLRDATSFQKLPGSRLRTLAKKSTTLEKLHHKPTQIHIANKRSGFLFFIRHWPEVDIVRLSTSWMENPIFVWKYRKPIVRCSCKFRPVTPRLWATCPSAPLLRFSESICISVNIQHDGRRRRFGIVSQPRFNRRNARRRN